MAAVRVVICQFDGIDHTPALPLAAGVLVAAARQSPQLAAATTFDIELARRPLADVTRRLTDADVIGLSLYPWNAAYSLAAARAARQANPSALIVAGGPAVPRRRASAKRMLADNPAVDLLVFGEGEVALVDILERQLDGADFAGIAGIAFRRRPGGELCFGPPPRRIVDLSPTASPYLDGTFDALLHRDRDRFGMALVETNRGCPFSCTFCDWSLTKKVAEMPMERVTGELDWIVANGFCHIAITDANFGIRRRDDQIARHLAALKRATGRPTFCYFYLTKNDHRRNLQTIEIMQEAGIGCCAGLAVQDFDDEVIAAVKRDNIQTGESQRLRQILGARGIATSNDLILGLPRQTYASFTRTVVEAMPAYPRHEFVLALCHLLDNTELADPEQRRILGLEVRRCRWTTTRTGWDPVVDESLELVVGTREMPIDDWRRTLRFAYLACAAYNLRLLRVPLHALPDCLGADARDYLEYLCERMDEAAPGTVLAALADLFRRYADSILASETFVLPAIPGGPAVDLAEAVALTCLRDRDRFYDEIEHQTEEFVRAGGGDPALVAEMFDYQRLITAAFGQTAPREQRFAHDWPAFAAAGGTGEALTPRPVTVRFTPPTYAAAPDVELYAATHVACLRAHASTGELETVGRVAA